MDTLATLQVYKQLADWYERQGQPAMRDRFLILAAETAFSAGKPDEAERLRQRLLQGNPHHMLKPFSSFSQALQSTNIQIYIHDLQMNYPPATAENLLQSLRGGTGPTPNLPQTAPLIDFQDEPTMPLGSSVESLKVYPLREEPDATLPPKAPVKETHFNVPVSRKQPIAPPVVKSPPRPATTNTSASLGQPLTPRQPSPARSAGPVSVPNRPTQPASEDVEAGGAWLSLLLFGLAVTAGVVLIGYTLARPFLPPEWLP